MDLRQSDKLQGVAYDVRGPLLDEAARMESEGHLILKLNIGNPAPFGFEAPDEILQAVTRNLPTAQGYSESKGLYSARTAVEQYYQLRGIDGVGVDDIYLGNGVSELISMTLQALLNDGDEVLIPAPDYPLWTAVTSLCGGRAVHYRCDEQADWLPDLADLASKVSDRTKALVVINPNNPTGAVYPREMLEALAEFARQHDLVLFADEIYDKILYDDATHTVLASLAPDVVCLTFSGLSKAYRVAGFRAGWVVVSGPKQHAENYIAGLSVLANMRLCPNVPSQHAIQTALGGYQSINDLILPGGRLLAQRDKARHMYEAQGGVVRLPTLGPAGLSDRRRRKARPRPAPQRANPVDPRSWIQLAGAGPPPDRHAAEHRGARGRDREVRGLPGHLPALVFPPQQTRRRPARPFGLFQ